ncbi:TonB-dependent receptor [Tistrella bauzanensis]|uniref:TonB-dependent receptor plug domain-containing protein n=1 Tax=Tistrella TaxID=171436 RepID=UPI0031F69CAA
MHTSRRYRRINIPTRPSTAARLVAGGALVILQGQLAIAPARADEALSPLVVSATRTAVDPDRIGSAVTVIEGDSLRQAGTVFVVDALRRAPGVSFSRTGGPGSATNLRLRGTDDSQTKILIDGVEVNDPASASGGFDLGRLLADDVDRIEVLRGPQSALYGADAIGGVVNIITRRGLRDGGHGVEGDASVEAGAYRSQRVSAALRAAGAGWDAAISAVDFRTEGFSRLEGGREDDGFTGTQIGLSGGVTLSDMLALEATGTAARTSADFDPSSNPEAPGTNDALSYSGRLTAIATLADGRVENRTTLSGARLDRESNNPLSRFQARTEFDGVRQGIETQTDIMVDDHDDILTLGLGTETERATIRDARALGDPVTTTLKADATTTAIFGQYQAGLWDQVYLTAGLRRDDHDAFGASTTWRFTGAWVIPGTGITLRGSLGTGTKAPSLYQLYHPTYGDASLDVEKSCGYDLGIEQSFLEERLTLGATWFRNDIRNMLSFDSAASRYRNTARARTEGVELSARATPADLLSLQAAYTYLETTDLDTGGPLPRRPRHSLFAAADLYPWDGSRIGAEVTHVGAQQNSASRPTKIRRYTVLGLNGDQRLTDSLTAFARLDNVFDVDYQEVDGYATPGRSVYLGLRATF